MAAIAFPFTEPVFGVMCGLLNLDRRCRFSLPRSLVLISIRKSMDNEEDGAGIFGRRNGVREAGWIGTRRGGEGGKKEEKRGKW